MKTGPDGIAARVRDLETQAGFTYFDVSMLGVGVATYTLLGHTNNTNATIPLNVFVPIIPSFARYLRASITAVDSVAAGPADVELIARQSLYASAANYVVWAGQSSVSKNLAACVAVLAVTPSLTIIIRPSFSSSGPIDLTVEVHGYYV